MNGRNGARLAVGVLLGVVAGACWLWWISAAVFQAGPVLLPFLLGLALAMAAGLLLWTSTARPATESTESTE
jgi:hypothetical protein